MNPETSEPAVPTTGRAADGELAAIGNGPDCVGGALDPHDLMLDASMSRAQVQVITLTSGLSAPDGYDLLSITFAAPVLSRGFAIGSGGLGVLLSSSLVGALVGSFGLAALADVIGRRPVALISLAMMAAGMFVSALCGSLVQLAAVRVFTGVGIGAMVVVINPIAVEVANRRSRSLAIAMMSLGYPLGGTLGGAAGALLLRHYGWPAIFVCGGMLALILAPLAWFALPESLTFLLARRRPSSLAQVNALLAGFGHQSLTALPPPLPDRRAPYPATFRRDQAVVTAGVATISFLTFMTIYFFLSWQPKMLVNAGLDASSTATVASIGSLTGANGCALFGLLSRVVGSRHLAVGAVLSLGICVAIFGMAAQRESLIAFAIGSTACVALATVGIYMTAARAFEPAARATGTGFVIGSGRIGSAVGPALAGELFSLGEGRAMVSALIGLCAVVAGGLLAVLKAGRDHPISEKDA